jgi:hypothetical protein
MDRGRLVEEETHPSQACKDLCPFGWGGKRTKFVDLLDEIRLC